MPNKTPHQSIRFPDGYDDHWRDVPCVAEAEAGLMLFTQTSG